MTQRAAVLDLDILGGLGRGAEGDGDVVGDLVAGDRHYGGVADGALLEHSDIRRAATDVHQAHAQFLFILGQSRHAGGQRLQHQITDFEATALHALDDVLCGGDGAGDDVHLHFQLHAAHADGFAHIFLPVDDEFLRQDVQDLLVGRQRDGAGSFHHAVHVHRHHFGILDLHHAVRVEALDVAAGDAGKHAGDLAVSHQLSFFQRPLDRLHRGVDIDHYPCASPRGC